MSAAMPALQRGALTRDRPSQSPTCFTASTNDASSSDQPLVNHPPASAIYLTRTHVAARRLHFHLLSATLNRSLSQRPSVSSLVNARIIPRDCCRRDHVSGLIVTQSGLFERKRKLELEKFKEGLRVWLEKKARAIKKHKSHVGGVGILVWRFTKRSKGTNFSFTETSSASQQGTQTDHVSNLRRFWEDVGVEGIPVRTR
ncbi:hypothetical protein M438DRAFT_389039 [Aureobasidium pullulans EXF-150]|uniref:Uncharacterized protein n=1 Tax=Aureobasidium pullulans EXF-150 TaxID=1043002 RepID=A0A074XU92_AURPU|nr:uncharacterized protein M438DRAFT_389039 [Aureobasidium pullulans EXF-150]KEQ87184.1 hypothetical protein M438DRAFT_389039 [Aureobasidium pullulans EXF-150]